jgi:hypothetical protein
VGCVDGTVVAGRVVTGGSVTGGAVSTGGDVAGGAVAGGVVWMVPPLYEPDDPEPEELFEPDVTLGATCVLPSVSMGCFAAPSTFCSVIAHCASTSLYTCRAR